MLNTIRSWLPWTKASRTTRIDYLSTTPSGAAWTDRRYDALAREGYQQAVWVFACTREITAAMREAPLLLHEKGDRTNEITTHPLLTLLNRPNPMMAWDAFLETWVAYYLLSGDTYLERVGSATGVPLELWPKRPDRMTVLPDPENFVRGYRYEVGGRAIDFVDGEILHTKSFNPLNDHYGMSALEAAARGIDAFNTGMSHNVALMQNGARPSGAFAVEGTLDDNQYQRGRTQIDELTSIDRRGRPLLLEGGAKWMEMGLAPKDLDWIAGLNDAARQIHAAFGVHPVLTGLQEGTFENQQQAQRGLFTRVALPLLEHFLGEFMNWVGPGIPGADRMTLTVDRDKIAALSDDQDSLYTRTVTAFEKGVLTRNEARVQLGFDDAPGGDVYYQDLQPRQAAPSATSGQRSTRAINAPPEKREALRAEHEDLQDTWITALAGRAADQFEADLGAVLRHVESAGVEAGVDVAAPTIKDGAWVELLTAASVAVATDFGERVRGEAATLRQDSPHVIFGLLADETLSFIAKHAAESARGITSTTRSLLRILLRDALAEGLGTAEIARRITAEFEAFTTTRAELIARTEVIRASNFGNQQAARATGLNLEREWVAVTDSRTRDAHSRADGQRAAMGSPFIVNGEPLMYPGDPRGSAGNTIQCRCVEIYHEVNA